MLKTALGIDLGINGCRAAFAADRKNTVETDAENIKDFTGELDSGNKNRKAGWLFSGKKNTDIHFPGLRKIAELMGRNETFRVRGMELTSQELIALPLMRLSESLKERYGKETGAVCFSVPLYFDSIQRRCLTEAAKIADINDIRVVSRPGAEMLYCLHGRSLRKNALVVDLDNEKCSAAYMIIEDGLIETISSDYISFDGIKDREAAERLCKNVIQKADSDDDYELYIFINENDFKSDLKKDTKKDAKKEQFSGNSTSESVSVEEISAFIQKNLSHENMADDSDGFEAALGAEEQASRFCRIYHEDESRPGRQNLIMDNFHSTVRIRLNSGESVCIIEKNTVVPYRCSRVFKTSGVFQRDADILFTEGEHGSFHENRLVCGFQITGITPRLRAGQEKIKVDFNIDENGVFKVEAFSLSDGRRLKVRFPGVKILTEADIKRSREKLTALIADM